MLDSSTNPHQDAHALIDIGSNSVRMVVYHALARVPVPLFNEKYYCALAKGLAQSGQLNPSGAKKAAQAFGRFMVMARRLHVVSITVLATAAVRQASDGAAFVKQLSEQYDTPISVITGTEEAQLAAHGIQAAFHHPEGLCADLGGGSMELALLANRSDILHPTSLSIGSLSLAEEAKKGKPKLRKMLEQSLSTCEWLNDHSCDTLYVIGGTFRAIAKMHMQTNAYPLALLHGYQLSIRQIEQIVQQLAVLPSDMIATLPGVPPKRAESLYPAALLLQLLMQRSGAQHVIFSVSGIREGALFKRLNKKQRATDPLFASAQDLASLAGRKGQYADELFEWMRPLFPHEGASYKRLRKALCYVSELAWTVDPNVRGEWAFLRIIQSAIKGVSHRERIILALALYHRHHGRWRLNQPAIQLLTEQDRLWARCAGLAANLAFNLSGSKSGNLHHARLLLTDDKASVSLELDDDASPLRTAAVKKRVEGLGEAFKALSSLRM